MDEEKYEAIALKQHFVMEIVQHASNTRHVETAFMTIQQLHVHTISISVSSQPLKIHKIHAMDLFQIQEYCGPMLFIIPKWLNSVWEFMM